MKTRFIKHRLSLIIASLLALLAINSHAFETTRVSVNSEGREGNRHSHSGASISADGRFVAFQSEASNLVEGDTNETSDVFVHDRTTGATKRVSINSAGQQGNTGSESPAISADGLFVAFQSKASNLVEGDTNGTSDVFIHDRTTGATKRVSIDSAGQQGNTDSESPAISADGRYVAFQSEASNLVEGDSNDTSDVFVHDRTNGATTRVSVDSAGRQAIGLSSGPVISTDGRIAAFRSEASNLVEGDANGFSDFFVHDRNTGITTRISISSAGLEGNGNSIESPSISADGRYVAFLSEATNLVTGGGTSGQVDLYLRDRTTNTTTRVSSNTGYYGSPYITADGHYVAFTSFAKLLEKDTNSWMDVYVWERTGTIRHASINTNGQPSDGTDNRVYSINSDGRFAVISSNAINLVGDDTNGVDDNFVHDFKLKTTQTADLKVAVTSQSASVKTGQRATYTYTVTNNGPDSIDEGDKLLGVIANGDVVSLRPSQGNCTKAVVFVCRFRALAAGASVTLTAVIKANSNPLTQQLSVNAPPVDNVPDNNSLTVSTPVTP